MRTKSDVFSIFVGLLSIVLASCSEKEGYSCFHHIENGKWYRNSPLVFTIDSLTPSQGTGYEVTVELTTNRSYPYRDLWLQIEQDLTDSLIRTDTLRCLLADEYGRWLGSGIGGLNQLSLPYRSFIPRDSMYHYRLTIRQAMGDELLRGVEKVGIKLVEVRSNTHRHWGS